MSNFADRAERWVWPHWTDHVTTDDHGNLIDWRDHPGCHYCEVLSGRYAKTADRPTPIGLRATSEGASA